MNNIFDAAEFISSAFLQIEKSSFEESNKISNAWEKVLKKIKRFDDEYFGQKLYEHSKIIDFKNGIALIETENSGWSQMIQLNSKFILKGLKIYVPELNIQTLAFRTKGSNAMLSSVNYESEFEKLSQKKHENMKEREQILKKYERNSEKNEKNTDLPQDILDKFESMKSFMLTKKNI